MGISIRPSQAVFALILIGLGVVGFVYGDFAMVWQPVPKWVPGREALAYLCAALELLTGIGLLLRPAFACRVLFPYLALWVALLKVPGLVAAPQVMASWGEIGEILIILAGGWCLFTIHAGSWEKQHLGFLVGAKGIRAARLLLIAALPMIGLIHIVYDASTASYVPAWLPYPLGWAYLTGAGSLAAAAGMLVGVLPRLAANLEAAMLWVITLLVWIPADVPQASVRLHWTAIFISSAIATGAWLVADSYRGVPWLASGKAGRQIAGG